MGTGLATRYFRRSALNKVAPSRRHPQHQRTLHRLTMRFGINRFRFRRLYSLMKLNSY